MANAKISELAPASTLTGTEQLPVAIGGANRRASAEQIRTFARADRPIALIVDGDSKGVLVGNMGARSALHWALARSGVQVRYDPTLDNLAVGGSVSGANGGASTGLTSPGRLASAAARIQAAVAAGFAPWVVLKIGANHVGGANAPDTILANVRKYWEGTARANGAVGLLLMSVDPRTSAASSGVALTADNAVQGHGINAAFRAYGDAVHDVIFVDSHDALADPGSGFFYPLGGFALNGNATMYDGLHESMNGAYQQSHALAAALARIAPPRRLTSGALNDALTGWSATSLRGNLLGSSGRFGLTGGVAGQVTLSGGGGVTGVANWVPARLMSAYPMLDGTLSGSLAVAISSVPYAPMSDVARSDQMATRLTFSGTPSANGSLSISAFVAKPADWDHTVPVEFDADMYANALTGCHGLELLAGLGGSGWGVGGNDNYILPPMTGRLRPYHPLPSAAPSAPGAYLSLAVNLNWRAGVAMSGSLDLFAMGVSQYRPLPAPA